MTRTAEIPVRAPLSDIPRKAGRVEPQSEPQPPGTKFLHREIAHSLLARLKVSEPRHRRIAPCFPLHDLSRRGPHHTLKMFPDVGRGGTPVPFRNALPGAPFPRPMQNLLPCFVSRGRALGLCGCVRIFGWAPSTSSAPKTSTAASGCRPGTSFWESGPRGQYRSAYAQVLRAARLPRALACTDVYGKCTGVYGFCMASLDLGRPRPHDPARHNVGNSAPSRPGAHESRSTAGAFNSSPASTGVRRKPRDAGPWCRVCGWSGEPVRCGTVPCRGEYDPGSFNVV